MTALKFKVGDRITVEATVMGVNTPCEWIAVEFPNGGYGTIGSPDDVATLIERPKTPGQRAYDEYSSGGAMPSWDDLGPGMQRKWNDVAEAARS